MVKNNNNNIKLSWSKLRIILVIAGILITIGIVYATINNNSVRIEKVEDKAETNQIDIVEIKTDIKYIRKSVDDNTVIQQEILKEIRK